MENKSFYFKWNGFKGYRKKYLLELINNEIKFELSESFEQRIQVYTRNLILTLIEKKDTGISQEGIDDLIKQCGIENQQRHLEKIHSILKFLDFILKENNSMHIYINQLDTHSSTTHQIFTLTNSNTSNQILFKINKEIIEETLINDINFAEKYYQIYNDTILNKSKLWGEEISQNEKKHIPEVYIPPVTCENEFEEAKEEFEQLKTLDLKEINELDQYKANITGLSNDNEDAGFALLRGNNWLFYMKKLYCIIGRAAFKHGLTLNNTNTSVGNTTWLVDVDLGQNRKISKQHALIAYNFQTCSFEIKNLSKKFTIKVNGETMGYNEEMPLSSKSSIVIGNQEFYFLLPL